MHQDQFSKHSVRRKSALGLGASAPGRVRRGESRRAAFARPRVLLAAVAAVVGGSAMWAAAQNSKPAKVGSPAKSSGASSKQANGPVQLGDLPNFVRSVARSKRSGSDSTTPGKKEPSIRPKRFALTERDLTPNSPSDERQPTFSPTGELIAFVSNGADTNGDGRIDAINAENKFHLWYMNRDGSQQTQVTGLTPSGPNADRNFDQLHPTWSPDGNELFFLANGFTTSPPTQSASNIFRVRPFEDGNFALPGVQPPVEQRTFFQSGRAIGLSFGAGSTTLAFAHSANLPVGTGQVADLGDNAGDFDIFTIDRGGGSGTLKRLTGGAADPAGATADDLHPAFSLQNAGVLYFSSNRLNNSNTTARRIYLMNADGTNKQQITDPTARTAGVAADEDDYPAPSLALDAFSNNAFNSFTERVGFQSNSRIDASDNARDLNVWSLSNATQPTAVPSPTPIPPPTPIPALNVGSFNNGQVKAFDATTGNILNPDPFVNTGAGTNRVEGVVYGPDTNGDNYPELFVSVRNANRVDRYDGRTGAALGVRGVAGDAVVFENNNLKLPTDLAYPGFGRLVYVASGGDAIPVGGTTQSTNNIKRFDAFTGGIIATDGDFTNPGAAGISNGIEGIEFGPDGDLFASALFNGKVVRFNPDGGVDNPNFAVGNTADDPGNTENNLSFPTGLAFGPDNNLYVSSSNNDNILRFNGMTGAFIDIFVNDNNGATFDLDAPEGLTFGTDGNLYVSSFNSAGGAAGSGDRVLRFFGPGSTVGTPGQGFPSPTRTRATFATGSQLSGPSYLTFNPSAILAAQPTPTATPVVTATPPPSSIERTGNVAVVESSQLSSANGRAASQLSATDNAGQPVGEDVSADREPGFARSVASAQDVAQLAFSSQRRTESAPGTATNSAGSVDARPVVRNPFGGPSGTHDIWSTVSEDFTPPVLTPVAVGNARFPLLAPGPQSPFPAPRTFEEGLIPGQQARIAFVLDERESGLGSVGLDFYNADVRPNVSQGTSNINDMIPVQTFREIKPGALDSFSGTPSTLVTSGNGFYVISDAGAPTERQANAVAGDGQFYVEARWTPPTTSDFYFDIAVADVDGNSFLYDNIYGLSNRQFVKQSSSSDLLVFDYSQGQAFPFASGVARFANMAPMENYYLTIPARIGGAPPVAQPAIGVDVNPTTLSQGSVDIWRILCRGPLPEEVLRAYAPTQTLQIDQAVGQAGANAQGTPAALTARTRSLAVSSSSVIWASPYAGLVFSGPGTIFDTETQRRITNFLQLGGRFFLSGRSIAFSLTANGQQSNNFLTQEMGANFTNEVSAGDNQIAPIDTGRFDIRQVGDPLDNPALNTLQIPYRNPGLPVEVRINNTFLDGRSNGEFGSPGTGGTDGFTSATISNGRTLPAYSINGTNVGQRIERDGRSNNFQSRAVFLGFGFEGVNRRYIKNGAGVIFAVNTRPVFMNRLRAYFKTGGISGQVVNDETNQPVPNFLLQVSGEGGPYFVSTDSQGRYTILGLPSGGYGVVPATRTVNGRQVSSNPGYTGSFSNDAQGAGFVGPNIDDNVNFRVIPAPLSSLSGAATQSGGTFANRSDDSALPNVRVLLRSTVALLPSGQFPNGGRFAQLTRTDAGGRFNFAGVPTGVDLEVIFNPTQADIPPESGISLGNTGDAGEEAFGVNFGRRIIPDAQRPQPINLVDSNPFVLNDGTADTPADDPIQVDANGIYRGVGGPILVPVGRTVNGQVFLNASPIGNATVRLSGTSQAGVAVNLVTTTVATTGAYAFFDVPRGTYQITASFTRNGIELRSDTVTVTITSQDVVAPRLRIFKQDLSGRVTVNGGAPGEALSVQLLTSSGAVATDAAGRAFTTQTNTNGDYFFQDVPPGTYVIRATRRGVVRDSTAFTVAQFAATAETAAGPDPNQPNTGDRVAPTVNFSSFALSGTATLNGNPAPGQVVQLLDASGNPFTPNRAVTTGANGAFAFNDLDNGTYFVRTSIRGRNGVDVATSAPIALNGDRPSVDLPLFLYTLRGVVRFRGAPTAGLQVEVLQNGTVIARTTTNAAGGYTLDGLVATPSGTVFQVRATRLVNSFVFDQTPLVNVVVVRDVNAPLIVEVPPLDLLASSVSGRVFLNGRPVAGVLVQLAAPTGGGVFVATRTNSQGAYRFDEVPTGSFRLRAFATGDTVERLITFSRGQSLTNIDLRLFLQSIRGRVLLNRAPLVGQVVELIQGNRVVQRTRSGAGGFYVFSNLVVPANARFSYVVRVTRLGSVAQRTVSNVVRNGATYNVPDIAVLSQAIRVTVLLNGRPTRGASVLLLQGATIRARGTSAANGQVLFSDLAPGTYTVRASQSGDTTQRNVGLSANGSTVNVNLDLFLQSIEGRILANTTAVRGQSISLIQGNRTVATTTSDASGNFRFPNLLPGTYILRAERAGAVVTQTVVIVRTRNARVTLVFALQSVRGTVTLDNLPAANATVSIAQNTRSFGTTRTDALGRYSFTNLPVGSFIVTAVATSAGRSVSGTRSVTVARGRDSVVSNIALFTPPADSASEEFQPIASYQISIPFTDSTAPYSTTTVNRAFSVPQIGAGGVVNYRLFRRNPLTRSYEELSGSSLIRRGEGYFLQPQARGVSIRRPADDATRRPTSVTEFNITLRRNLSFTDANNGFNLIGFPFDPARFNSVDYPDSAFIVPANLAINGRTRLTYREAVGAGYVAPTLFTLNSTDDSYIAVQDNLEPYTGYYVQTFVDGLIVALRVDTDTTP